MDDAKETYSLKTYGRVVAITRQALVNDSLDAFGQISARLGAAAAAFEAGFLSDLLLSNSSAGPQMADGFFLFDASNHLNQAGSGAAPSLASLDEARKGMRGQVGLAQEHIAVDPRYILCGPAQETKAQQIVSSIQATETANVNVFSTLQVVTDVRITGNHWYLVADPAQIDGLEFSYLDGQVGPYTETRVGFDVDGIEITANFFPKAHGD